MSEFVNRSIGARQHSYPETPRGGGAFAFARNYARGPINATDIGTGGTIVPWGSVTSTGNPGVNVPITPRVTGIVRIIGVISVKSVSGVQETVQLMVTINGVQLQVPFFETPSIEAGGQIDVPILVETDASVGGPLPVNTTANVQIIAFASTGGVLQLVSDTCTLAVQEVSLATG